MTSQIGYLKLLITRSILSGPLDFVIKRVACIFIVSSVLFKTGCFTSEFLEQILILGHKMYPVKHCMILKYFIQNSCCGVFAPRDSHRPHIHIWVWSFQFNSVPIVIVYFM